MGIATHTSDPTFKSDDMYWNNMEMPGVFSYLNYGNMATSPNQVEQINSTYPSATSTIAEIPQEIWQNVAGPEIQKSTAQVPLDVLAETAQSVTLGQTRSWLDNCDASSLSDVSTTAHSWLSHTNKDRGDIQRQRFALKVPSVVVEDL